ncbi:Zinc finger protein 208, partial [Stegodyphus mimosarum]
MCHSWFGLFDFFVKHMETDSHSYSCQQCGLVFLQAYLRRRHIEKNHPEVANICEICGLKLSNSEAVWSHNSIHNISYECLKCHRRFVRKELLILHSEMHLPPTPCPWEGCNRKLPTKIGLFNHLRMHK